MTAIRPLGAGSPDPLDLAAAEQLERNEVDRLPLVRARAEKWVGAVAALTGILGTALVLKGPADVTKLVLGWRVAAACALGAAIVLLSLATFRAYRAAFGEPEALRSISAIPLKDLHKRLTEARAAAAADALRDLAAAVRLAFAGIAGVAAAVAITWFAPTTSSTSAAVCISVGNTVVARLGPDAVNVKALDGRTTIRPCP